MRGGAYFWGLAVPPPQGEGPRRSSILGVPFYLCVRRTIKFGIHMGKGLVFNGASHAPVPSGGAPALSLFGFLLHLCLHPFTQNDHLRQGNTLGRACFLRSATPPIQGEEPRRSPIFWFLSNYVYIHRRITTKFDVVARTGKGSF